MAYEHAVEHLGVTSEEYGEAVVDVERERLERAATMVDDAERHLEATGGPKRSDSLETVVERLGDRIAADLDATSMRYEGDIENFAVTRWDDAVFSPADTEGFMDAGRIVLAVRVRTYRAMIAATLDDFADVPTTRCWEDLDVEIAPGDEALAEENRRAIAMVDDVLESQAENPLLRYLLRRAVELVERADTHVERLISHGWRYGSTDCTERRDRAYVHHRSAAVDAKT